MKEKYLQKERGNCELSTDYHKNNSLVIECNKKRKEEEVNKKNKEPIHYSWQTWGGKKYEGEIIDAEDDCIYVKCTDGITRAVDIANGRSDV